MNTAVYLTKTYQPGLLLLSIVVAVVAGYAALELVNRMDAAERVATRIWLAAGAVTLGSGIWAIHFIGMLALLPTFVVVVHGGGCLDPGALAGLSPRTRPRQLDRRLGLHGRRDHRHALHWHVCHGDRAGHRLRTRVDGVVGVDRRGRLGDGAAVGFRSAADADACAPVAQERRRAVHGGIAGMHYAGMAGAEFPSDSTSYATRGVDTLWLTLPGRRLARCSAGAASGAPSGAAGGIVAQGQQ